MPASSEASTREKRLLLTVGLLFLVTISTWIFSRVHGLSPKSSRAKSPQTTHLSVTGSSTLAPAVTAMARKFESSHPGLVVEVTTGGSGLGIAAARDGTADIGMSSRDLTPDETGLLSTVVGFDGLCLVVHPSNTVTGLTSGQVRDIFTGHISRWSQVGGNEIPIIPMGRSPQHGEYAQFLESFHLTAGQEIAVMQLGDNQQVVNAVAERPSSISYMSLGIAESQMNSPIKLLAIDGVAATSETVWNGKYPLIRPLLLLTGPSPSALVKEFIQFTRTEAAKDCLRDEHLLPKPD